MSHLSPGMRVYGLKLHVKRKKFLMKYEGDTGVIPFVL